MKNIFQEIIDYKILKVKSKKEIYDDITRKISGTKIFMNNHVLLIPTKFNKIEILDKEYFLFDETSFFFYNYNVKDNRKDDFIRFIIFSHIFKQLKTKSSITESLLEKKLLKTVTEIHFKNNELSISGEGEITISFNGIIDNINKIFIQNYNQVNYVLHDRINIEPVGSSIAKFSLEDINSFSQIEELFHNNNIDFAKLISNIKCLKKSDIKPNSIHSTIDVEFFHKLINLFLFAKFSNFNYFYYVSSITNDIESFNESFGTFVLSAKYKFRKRTLQDVKQLNHSIWSFISIVELDNQIKITRNHAIKSAIAAIMSRNMSHNLGSHVLSYASVNLSPPFDMQVLLEYIQERMDFIAQITAEPPQWTMPMHFVGQLMRNFYKQRILLNYIAESEGLNAQEFNKKVAESIANKDKEKNNGELQIIILDKDGEKIVPNERRKIDKDPLVAIPGGITGAHAFYTILENIIRNAAKHSFKTENEEGLKIYVQIDDSVDKYKYVTVKVYDNVTKNIKTGEKDDQGKDIMLFQKLEDKLKQALIEETGSLRYENWGLAEIKIGAGFLQKKDQFEIGSEIKDFNNSFIHLFPDNPNKVSFIGYEFNIPKPKYVLIILNNEKSIDKENELRNNGIYLKTYKDIESEKNLDYEFVLYQKTEEGKEIIDKRPPRSFQFEFIDSSVPNGNISIKINGDKENSYDINADLRIILYKLWINKLLTKKSYKNVCLEVSPYEQGGGGSSISDIKAYKYTVESLLPFYEKEEDKEVYKIFVDFLKDAKPKIPDLYKNLIKNNNQSIKKLINKKTNVVSLFKKYEEDIETLPDIFKESSDKKSDDNSNDSEYKRFFDGNQLIKENYDKSCENANGNTLKIKYKRHASSKADKEYYVEALSGSQSYFNQVSEFVKNNNTLSGESGSENNENFAYSLIETGLLDITVVDERVYEFYKGNTQIRKRFNSVNIRVFKGLKELLKDTTRSDTEDTLNNDILIIHQGIIDKIDKKEFHDNESTNNYTKLVNKYTYQYITSGSGDKKIGNNSIEVLRKFKFIPFSNVRSALMRQYPEKYILVQSLMKI